MGESGDRAAFLAPARARLAGPVWSNPVHVPPAPLREPPEVRFTGLDPDDLAGSFVRAAEAVDAEVSVVSAAGPTVVELAARYGARSVVCTPEGTIDDAVAALTAAGVVVESYSVERAAAADLGLTGAVAGVAATGSIVLDSRVAGSRGAGLLPPVHVCVLEEWQLVPAPIDVLRPLADGPPPAFVLVGGPSRTGDVEQILTLGVHGPRHLHVVLVRSSP